MVLPICQTQVRPQLRLLQARLQYLQKAGKQVIQFSRNQCIWYRNHYQVLKCQASEDDGNTEESTVSQSEPKKKSKRTSEEAVQGIDEGQKLSESGELTPAQLDALFNKKMFLSSADKVPVFDKNKQVQEFPNRPGIYAVYDPEGNLQYVGLSRKINTSIKNHVDELPHLVDSVRFLELPGADRQQLMEGWKAWLQEHITTTGVIPPGNQAGQVKWQQRRPKPVKPDIRLTPGKGIQDLTCSLNDLIDMVVKNNKVVCFIKGTRTSPECGFSYKVLSILNELKINYETVNVLDDVHNPGLRESIKEYTQWPTIPQIFVDGEFVGGADIVETMHINGELQELFKKVEALTTP